MHELENVRPSDALRILAVKAALSGVIIAAVSEIARRQPGFGACRRS